MKYAITIELDTSNAAFEQDATAEEYGIPTEVCTVLREVAETVAGDITFGDCAPPDGILSRRLIIDTNGNGCGTVETVVKKG